MQQGTRLSRFWEALGSGAWVDRERMMAYPIIFLGVEVVVLGLGVLLGSGMTNAIGGEPVGTDFLSFYGTSTLILDGRAADAYDVEALHAVQQHIAGPGTPFYAWLYPPIAMLLVAPLALLPYGVALVAWLLATGAVFVTGVRRIVGTGRTLLPVVAFPAVFLTVGHGQNALLSAGLLAWALSLLPTRELAAGVVAGVLAYKPQLGLLLPVAFAAGRHWRAVVGAALGVVALAAASLAIFGPHTWVEFLGASGFAVAVLEEGLVEWGKMTSAFAAARLVGLPTVLAWMLQGGVSLLSTIAVGVVWARPYPHALRWAALALGTLLATPFALDYEATFLGVAIAALVVRGRETVFLGWEKSSLALLWVSPLLWRMVALPLHTPLGFLCLAAAATLVWRRLAAEDAGAVPMEGKA